MLLETVSNVIFWKLEVLPFAMTLWLMVETRHKALLYAVDNPSP